MAKTRFTIKERAITDALHRLRHEVSRYRAKDTTYQITPIMLETAVNIIAAVKPILKDDPVIALLPDPDFRKLRMSEFISYLNFLTDATNRIEYRFDENMKPAPPPIKPKAASHQRSAQL